MICAKNANMESLESLLFQRLKEKLSLSHYHFEDQSASHAAHYEAAKDGETHIQLSIVSADFEGKSRVERHRMVYAIVDFAMKERGLHALALKLATPEEAKQ